MNFQLRNWAVKPGNRTVSIENFQKKVEKNCYFLFNRNICRSGDFAQTQFSGKKNQQKTKTKHFFYNSKTSTVF